MVCQAREHEKTRILDQDDVCQGLVLSAALFPSDIKKVPSWNLLHADDCSSRCQIDINWRMISAGAATSRELQLGAFKMAGVLRVDTRVFR